MSIAKTSLRRLFRPTIANFRSSENGVAGVEFALISPAFFFLIFVILETALVFVAEEVLDDSVTTAARMPGHHG